MDLLQLLSLFIDTQKTIKIMRHSDADEAKFTAFTTCQDTFERYQSLQNKGALKADYLVSCIKDRQGKTIVHGVYQIGETRPAQPSDLPQGEVFAYLQDEYPNYVYTQLTKIKEFSKLEDRIVIDWGKAAIQWNQYLNKQQKRIIEIRAQGKIEEFSNYDHVLLSYQQLQQMIQYSEANQKWHQMLSVNGVYLIANNRTGQLYIGSAYGKNGILGRWSDYAKNGHGGNRRLAELFEHHPELIQEMQYSILTTVSSNKTPTEIINLENFYKKKIGKAAVTLNNEGKAMNTSRQARYELLYKRAEAFINDPQVRFSKDQTPSEPQILRPYADFQIAYCFAAHREEYENLYLYFWHRMMRDAACVCVSLDQTPEHLAEDHPMFQKLSSIYYGL